MSKAATHKSTDTARTIETQTLKVELKEIPREFQRSIEQNLRIARASQKKAIGGNDDE